MKILCQSALQDNRTLFARKRNFKLWFFAVIENQIGWNYENDFRTLPFEPRCEKTGLRGFRPGPTLTGLYYRIRWLEA